MTRQRAGGWFAPFSSSARSRRRRRSGKRRPRLAPRTLRLESVEPRTLLASISGTVLDDLTGNGFTPDDSPRLEPVTLELLRDVNTNGLPDDAVFDTTTSSPADGQFSFGSLADGKYFLRAVTPSGTTQTAGPAYYTIEIVNDQPFNGGLLVVDDFSDPVARQTYVIASQNPDPTTLGPHPAELAGVEREITIDVMGAAGLLSASGSVGGGYFDFGSLGTSATVATITYDGGGFNTPVDFTVNGAVSALRLDFVNPETGVAEPDLPVDIQFTSSGGTASFQGLIDFVPLQPLSYVVPFAQFTPAGNFSFEEITGLEIVLGSANVRDADFRLSGLVATNPMDDGYDFGFFTPAEVTGRKTIDIDGDAQGDVPHEGVRIELWRDQDGDQDFDENLDHFVEDTQTAADGSYGFDNLADGFYFIREEVPAGFIQVGGQTVYKFQVVNNVVYAAGGLLVDDFDSPAPAVPYAIDAVNPNPTTIGPHPAEPANVQRTLEVEVLGTPSPASATGSIGAGIYDFGSEGPVGSKATLTYDVTGGSPLDLTADGSTGLRLDLLTVETGVGEPNMPVSVELNGPGGPGDTATFAASIPVSPNHSTSFFLPYSAFTVNGGFSFGEVAGLELVMNAPGLADVDFVLDRVVTADPQNDGFDFVNACVDSRLSGFVYVDANNNGVKEPGELPIPNTTITLIGVDIYGNAVNQVTTTDTAGFYEFTGLALGTYTVVETQPAAYLPGKATPGTLGGTASTDGNVISNVVFDSCGQDSQQNNFGELGLRYPSKRVLLFPFGFWGGQYDGRGEGDQVAIEGTAAPPATGEGVVQIRGVAELPGTDGDDTLVYDARTGQATLTTRDGRVETFDGRNTTLHFNARAGNDTVILYGTDGPDSLSLGPDSAALVGTDYGITVVGAETITVDGRGGQDVAAVSDSPGSDEFRAGPGRAWFLGDGFFHHFVHFESQHAESSAGGFDIAYLYDSGGDDIFLASHKSAILEGPGFTIEADAFKAVHAYATGGGHDEARLYDSPGNDTFVGAKSESMLYGAGFYNRAKFFEAVHAFANGGFDEAKLFDSVGDDTFEADPAEARLYGAGFYNRARGFDAVHGYSTLGGSDVARLTGSAGADHLMADATATHLWGAGYYLRAKLFEQVYAELGAGSDSVEIRDSSGDDSLTYAPGSLSIYWDGGPVVNVPGGGPRLSVGGFESATAISSRGGTDRYFPTVHDHVLTLLGPWTDMFIMPTGG